MRSLPKQINPLILPDASPSYQELLALRRLGKTNLAVKPTQIGTSNATQPENLGPFEYAHLRAPLPKDLSGSEIFPSQTAKQDTYFLMRRSKDGFISATGMFKIAFPWAKASDEKAEREYVKEKTETSVDETAGNLWISPVLALELAKEYQMLDWVRALLDPSDIFQTPGSAKKPITAPPKFDMPASLDNVTELPPTLRTRSRRSVSPSKSSPKKAISPRKSRVPRSTKEGSAAATTAASASLQEALNGAAENEEPNGTTDEAAVAETTEAKPKKGRSKKQVSAPAADEKVTVHVESTSEVKDEIETTQTNVSVEMPVSLPELPPAEDTEKMIAQAKQMVEEATKLQEKDSTTEPSSTSKAAKKRKSDEVEEDEDDKTKKPAQPTKKARVLEDKLRKERVRNRALVGVTATLALAAAIPYFF